MGVPEPPFRARGTFGEMVPRTRDHRSNFQWNQREFPLTGGGKIRDFGQNIYPWGCHAITHFFLHFHAITQMRKGFSRHHAHQKDLSRITHEGRFTQSRNHLFIFTQSPNKKWPFTQSRKPMGGPLWRIIQESVGWNMPAIHTSSVHTVLARFYLNKKLNEWVSPLDFTVDGLTTKRRI
jgi:hypothetical protein